jgi:zinc transporter ZupT
LGKLALAIVGSCLNLIDALATLYLLKSNQATELNPWLDFLYNISPGLFLFYKVFAVGLFVLLSQINNKLANYGLWAGVLLYLGVDLYHYSSFNHL